jgi:hypothetical protein
MVIPRPYPYTIPADLQDFLLGSAWISLPLIIFWFLSQRKASEHREEPSIRAIVLLGMVQIAIVALSGLLAVESARVWLFLQPLAMIPVGLELLRWNPWQRFCVMAIICILTAVMAQNMIFVQG